MILSKRLHTISRIFPYLWPKDMVIHMRLLTAILLLLGTVLFNVGVPLILRKVIGVISNPTPTIQFVAIALLISYGIAWMTGIIMDKLRWISIYRVIERGRRLLCIHLLDHLMSLSLRYHLARQTGGLINAMERAQFSFWPFFSGFFFLIVPTMVEILIAASILSVLYGILYGAILVLILSAYMFVSVYGSRWAVKVQGAANDKTSEASTAIVDSLMNYETVRYFVANDYEHKRCDTLLSLREKAATTQHTAAEIVLIIQSIIMGTGLVILTWLSGQQVMQGILKVSDFVLINVYLLQFMTPLSNFGYVLRDMNEGLSNFEEVTKILDEQPEITDKISAKPLAIKEGGVVFTGVSFGYDARRPILNAVSFEIKPKKTVAIVGATGAGKSTIARLLFRHYDVTEGCIRIDGQDIRDVTQASLQSVVGVVPQHTALFNDTLLYNITYGRPDATQEAIQQAIQHAHLNDFIVALPDGLNTKVGEQGLQLSGGERQRVATARVLLKNPAIFVFDEATSSLDTKTERLIQQNIEEVSRNATTLIIAHRLSTVIHADEIIVLDKGHIVEQGTHANLLSQGGVYAQLWAKQMYNESM
jgi:ABC-type transport system involved in Fe-S cluster assembly fused permease/ATPase subunit